MNKTLIIYPVVIILVIFTIYFVLKKLGLTQTAIQQKAEKEEEENILSFEKLKIFDPSAYKTTSGGALATDEKIDEWVQRLHQAFPYYHPLFGIITYYTDESAIFAVFRELSYQIQVSQISEQYLDKYSEDLKRLLEEHLIDSELSELYRILQQKPVK